MTRARQPWRFGPLEAAGDLLVVGAPESHHLALDPAAVLHRRGGEPLESLDWSLLQEPTLRVPQDRFPFPGAAARAGLLLTTLASGEVPTMELDESSVELRSGGGTRALRIDHHVGGYSRRAVRAAELLLAHLAATPAARRLLAEPRAVIARCSAAARAHRSR
jgi:hypothetical protein